MLLRLQFLPLACLCALVCVGCGEKAPNASTTEPLNTAPPLEAEVPTPAANETTTPAADAPKEGAASSENESASAANVDLRGMTFTAPATWDQNKNPNFVEAEFYLPGEEGKARMTIMQAGGDKQANIDRWIGQFTIADGDKPAVTEIDVDGKTATMVDIRGTFTSQRPGQGSAENQRMLAFIIPFSATNHYFVKATGPQGTMAANEDALVEFVKTGKFK